MREGRASRQPTKILRVGVLHAGAVVDERLLHRAEPVSIGSGLSNTFTLTTPGAPARFVLFATRGARYSLQLDERMSGRISLDGQSPWRLDVLKESGRAIQRGRLWSVPLDEHARGRVVFGETTVLFHFVDRPVAPPGRFSDGPLAILPGPLPKRRQLGGAYGLALALSVAVQIGYLVTLALEARPQAANVDDRPDQAIRVALADLADDVMPSVAGNGEVVQGEPIETVAELREADTPSLEADSAEVETDAAASRTVNSPAGNPQDRLALARGMIRQQAFWSTFAEPTGGGGYLPILEQVFNATDRDVDIVLARQVARGDGRLAAAQGGEFWEIPTEGFDTAGNAIGVDLGRSRTVSRAVEVVSGDERERVRVEAHVRHTAAQMVGAGRIDRTGLNQELRRRIRDVERCYERELLEDPTAGGRVVVQFSIDETGQAEDVQLVENEVGEAVGDCIGSRVRRWRFDAPEGGRVTVRKSYILMPAE